MEFLTELFKRLDNNSKFPKYQLERRVDIFFNVFLEDILSQYFNDGCTVQFICPEFPFKKEGNRQSTNVDYLCLKELDGKMELIFVELKTDVNSFDDNQLEIYMKDYIWETLITDINRILSPHGKYNPKYMFLINHLKKNKIPSNIKIRTLYIAPFTTKINNKIVKKGYFVNKNDIKLLETLLMESKSFKSEAVLIAEKTKIWDLSVFEICK